MIGNSVDLYIYIYIQSVEGDSKEEQNLTESNWTPATFLNSKSNFLLRSTKTETRINFLNWEKCTLKQSQIRNRKKKKYKKRNNNLNNPNDAITMTFFAPIVYEL